MKKFKKILWIIFVIMLFSVSCFIVNAEDNSTTTVASGECGLYGDNVVWELDSNGVLTVSGTGEMLDYTWTNFVPNTPWHSYEKKIKKVIIEDGITSIGMSSFYDLSYVTDVEISNDVLAIGSYAFSHCRSVKNFVLPSNLQYVGNYCFEMCYGITEFVFPQSVTKLGTSIFYACDNLKSVTLPSGITELPAATFSSCDSLENVVIPSGVKVIGNACFNDCASLKTIILPDNLKSINYMSFRGCSKLEEISIPDTVTDIGSEAFYSCSNLNSIKLPSKIESILTYTFYACYNLTNIEIPSSVKTIDTKAFYGCTKLESVSLQNGIQKINDYAFYNCPNLTSIYIPDSVTTLGKYAYGFYKDIYDEISVVPNAHVLCCSNSKAETYAKNNKIPYSIVLVSIDTAGCVYTGKEVTPNISIVISEEELNVGSDYVVTYKNNIEPGVALAKIEFMNDYSFIKGEFVREFRIGKNIEIFDVELDKDEYQYHMYSPDVTVSYGDTVLELNKDYEAIYTIGDRTWKKASNNNHTYLTVLGSCEIKIVGINDYIGEIIINFDVEKFDMSNAKLWTNYVYDSDGSYSSGSFTLEDFVYDGTPKKQKSFRVCDSMDTISNSYYTISYKNNIEVGRATMIITGKGDYYTGKLEKDFYIYPRAISDVSITKLPNKLVYTEGDTQIDVTGGEITIYYQDGGSETFVITHDMLHDYNLLYAGSQNVWVECKGVSDYYVITIEPKIYNCPYCGDEYNDEILYNSHISSEQAKQNAKITIKNNPGSTTINYGETLELTAVVSNYSKPVNIEWYVNGSYYSSGDTLYISPENNSVKITVKLVDLNGNVFKDATGEEILDTETVTVKAGFFQKLISFFKNLFGLNRTVIQSIFKGVF